MLEHGAANDRRPRLGPVAQAALAAAVLLGVLAYLRYSPPLVPLLQSGSRSLVLRNFPTAQWAAHPFDRQLLGFSLVGQDALVGLERQEVLQLLGAPDESFDLTDPEENAWASAKEVREHFELSEGARAPTHHDEYSLGEVLILPIDGYVLDIAYSKDDHVLAAIIYVN